MIHHLHHIQGLPTCELRSGSCNRSRFSQDYFQKRVFVITQVSCQHTERAPTPHQQAGHAALAESIWITDIICRYRYHGASCRWSPQCWWPGLEPLRWTVRPAALSSPASCSLTVFFSGTDAGGRGEPRSRRRRPGSGWAEAATELALGTWGLGPPWLAWWWTGAAAFGSSCLQVMRRSPTHGSLTGCRQSPHGVYQQLKVVASYGFYYQDCWYFVLEH